MKRTLVLAMVAILLLIGGYLLWMFSPSPDFAHLDGTMIPLPEHPSILLTVRHGNSFDIGDHWDAESLQRLAGSSKNTPPHWYLSLNPISETIDGKTHGSVDLATEDGVSWKLIPFIVSDNTMVEGDLSYEGLFSWDGKGPMKFHNAALIGNYVFIENITKNPDGTVSLQYKGEIGSDTAQSLGNKGFKYPPIGPQREQLLTLKREGDNLIRIGTNL